MEGRISTRLEIIEGRKFGRTVGIAFLLLAAFLFWRDRILLAQILGAIGAFLIVGAIVVPARLKPVERAWMWMALQISKVTTPIVMGIVYFLVVTPIGVVVRNIKGNPMSHSPGGGGYWYRRPAKQDADASGDMHRQF